MNNKIQRGSEVELMVAAEATKNGILVSMPLTNSSPYDLVFDGHGKILKIQCKRAYYLVDKKRNNGGK